MSEFLCKREQSQACLSYAERSQKSWAQHIKVKSEEYQLSIKN